MRGRTLGLVVGLAGATAATAIPVAAAGTHLTARRNSVAAHTAKAPTVRIKNLAYHPNQVTIRRGTAVRWLWLDAPADSHTVTSIRHHGRGLRFPGHPTAQWTGTYSSTFRKAGTYYYMCTVHDFMHGKIVVR